ncbi:SPOR domain-containing protein [Acidicapsa ligni]|uniref:SPOR domain-containing protein n=1 Tax=Acidicapsa ligni TaxID=542300 RepID=UPI0021DFD486|nr:SPOR domain-containing protein [Acidicapsa ligni]
MRTVFEEEDEEIAESYPPQDRELTLNSTTLLAIFFGLVLVCGLFFGLGYTLGRRGPSDAAALASTDTSKDSPLAIQTPGSGSSSGSGSKPSATSVINRSDAATPQATQATAPQPSEEPTLTQAAGDAVPKVPETAAAHVQPVALPTATRPAPPQATTVRPALGADSSPALTTAASTITGSSTGTIMVQIAAVSSPNDANVLVSALRKRGYSVVVRQQAGDALQHVQVGPFASRVEANTMKQKLLGDGYNAILK